MNWSILAVKNVRRIYDDLADLRQLPADYRWVNRIPSVFALDEEIMARYTGRVLAADIIMDDGKAVLRTPMPIRMQQTKVPNLKHGEAIPQSMLRVLARIEAGNASRSDNSIFENYIANRIVELRDGVYARMEALHVAMLQDSFSYDRLGIKISGLGWGMPSDLKINASTWATAATGTPITDIQAAQRIALQKYGVNLDRVTLSTAALLNMVKTTEFGTVATPFITALTMNVLSILSNDVKRMSGVAGSVLGMVVEVDDRQTWAENNYGTQTAAAYQTDTNVILTSQAADNNPKYWDWANGEVTETMPGLVPDMIGSFDGPVEGPIGFATGGDPQGNPPSINLWAVGRGFPRRHMEAVSAVLDVS